MDIGKALIDTNRVETGEYELPERTCFMHPWLHAGTIALIGGQRGGGKTWLGLALAYALTRGSSIGSWFVERPVGVLYLDMEMPQGEMLPRIAGLNRGIGKPHAPLDWYNSEYSQYETGRILNLNHHSQRQDLLEFLSACSGRYGVLILDNKSAAFPGMDENDKKDFDDVGQWLLAIRRIGVATVLICHFGKNSRSGIRGTSSVEDFADVSITLESPPGFKQGSEAVFQIGFSKSRGLNTDVKPFSISIHNERGAIQWHTNKPIIVLKDRIVKCLGQGMAQSEVHGFLNCSKAYTSEVKKLAIAEGLLMPSGLFTLKGMEQYSEINPIGYDKVNFSGFVE